MTLDVFEIDSELDREVEPLELPIMMEVIWKTVSDDWIVKLNVLHRGTDGDTVFKGRVMAMYPTSASSDSTDESGPDA